MRINTNLSYPVLQVRSKSLVQYQEYVFERSGRERLKLQNHMKDIRENYGTYSGTMTKGAKKRLTKAVSLLVQSSKSRIIYNPVSRSYHQFKLSFLTLTIPECDIKPDAKFCNKRLLEPMLRVLRRRHGLKSYIWKLELQKNGMVHYHISTDLFINHSDLKNEWNNILRRNNMLDDFGKRTGKTDPNSTDIKSVKQVKNFEAYLIKYIAKDEQNKDKVNSKIWDCSLNLKKGEFFKLDASWAYIEKLEELELKGLIESFSGERYTIYNFKRMDPRSFMEKKDLEYYNLHLTNIKNGTIKKQKDVYTSLSDSLLREARGAICAKTETVFKRDKRSIKDRKASSTGTFGSFQRSMFGGDRSLRYGFE